jgi:hypothetical protein
MAPNIYSTDNVRCLPALADILSLPHSQADNVRVISRNLSGRLGPRSPRNYRWRPSSRSRLLLDQQLAKSAALQRGPQDVALSCMIGGHRPYFCCMERGRLSYTVRKTSYDSCMPPSEETSPFLRTVRDAIRLRHLSIRTEEAYVQWVKRFILFHSKRHPAEMGEPQVSAFLTHLAVEGQVASSTQNQALNALVFPVENTGLPKTNLHSGYLIRQRTTLDTQCQAESIFGQRSAHRYELLPSRHRRTVSRHLLEGGSGALRQQ